MTNNYDNFQLNDQNNRSKEYKNVIRTDKYAISDIRNALYKFVRGAAGSVRHFVGSPMRKHRLYFSHD